MQFRSSLLAVTVNIHIIDSNPNQRKEVKVLTDQYSPTLNTNLAEMLLEIAERRITGILHTTGATRISRREFALKLTEPST